MGLVEFSFNGRITCLFVFVFMRRFDVDEILISHVILVHALSSEWMLVGSVHDFTKIALSCAWQTCCVAHAAPASPLVLTIFVPLTTSNNYASSSWQLDAFRYFFVNTTFGIHCASVARGARCRLMHVCFSFPFGPPLWT